MHTRTLGQGFQVSAIGLGCMGMSQSHGPDPGTREDMIGVVRGAVDLGVTFFDTPRCTAPTSTRHSSARRWHRSATRS
jgi:aryl-alcohol dehydrogenase-like predicted oxidoreductase